MSDQDNSKSLLIKQVKSHSQALCELLECDTTSAAPPSVIERSAVATRMLAGTSSLMGLDGWELVLTAYEDLLGRYNEAGLAWDERIAQFTSELIEREEFLVESYQSDPSVDFDSVVPVDGLEALGEEAKALRETMVSAPPPPPAPEPTSEPTSEPTPEQPAQQPAVQPDTVSPSAPAPMGGAVSELKRVYQALESELDSETFESREWSSEWTATLRSLLCFVDFYACSLEQMVKSNDPASCVKKSSLLPLKTVLSDFANEVSGSGGGVLDIVLNGEQTQIDPRILPLAGAILQQMVNDTFNRSEGSALGINVDAEEVWGAIRWRFTDNGNNFISDSQLDHEDQLAFYPGLKDVRKVLSRHHGVLWVEPRPEDHVRFEFTTPVTKSADAFMVWGGGARSFCVRSSQLCDLMPVDQAPKHEDSFGEFLTIDNKRVPLLKLETLFSEALTGGGEIAVIGFLEKRVAFYVPGNGELVEGKTLDGVVPVWHGPTQLVAQVGERRITLLEADRVLEGYLELTGGLTTGGISGGVVDDESELSNSQATIDSSVKTPPDQITDADGADDVEVLVVEQSDSLRAVLYDIFRQRRIRAAFATGVDEAVELIHARTPQVIVSEFRMPTMAAKVLVEALGKGEGAIPVLVTTSQSGKTADLLVEKLGAAGYLSKPLDDDEVANRIGCFLTERAKS